MGGDNWSHKQDVELMEYIKEGVSNGLGIQKALMLAGSKTKRGFNAVHTRWYTNLKARYEKQMFPNGLQHKSRGRKPLNQSEAQAWDLSNDAVLLEFVQDGLNEQKELPLIFGELSAVFGCEPTTLKWRYEQLRQTQRQEAVKPVATPVVQPVPETNHAQPIVDVQDVVAEHTDTATSSGQRWATVIKLLEEIRQAEIQGANDAGMTQLRQELVGLQVENEKLRSRNNELVAERNTYREKYNEEHQVVLQMQRILGVAKRIEEEQRMAYTVGPNGEVARVNK